MSSAGFCYSEGRLSERLGILRPEMKSLRDRHLRPESDWKKVGGEVLLAGSGIKRLWKALEARPAQFELSECLTTVRERKNGAAGLNGAVHGIPLGHSSMPIPVTMTVTRICPNSALVWAQQTDGLDRRTNVVWVGRNQNFTVGMRIQVAPRKNAPGIWNHLGPQPQRRYTPDEWDRRMKAGFKG